MIAGVGLKGRHQRGDVAHDEELARHGAEHGLRIDARVRAGDDHRLGALPPMRQRLVTRSLGRPYVGAKAAIAFDQRSIRQASQRSTEMLHWIRRRQSSARIISVRALSALLMCVEPRSCRSDLLQLAAPLQVPLRELWRAVAIACSCLT